MYIFIYVYFFFDFYELCVSLMTGSRNSLFLRQWKLTFCLNYKIKKKRTPRAPINDRLITDLLRPQLKFLSLFYAFASRWSFFLFLLFIILILSFQISFKVFSISFYNLFLILFLLTISLKRFPFCFKFYIVAFC